MRPLTAQELLQVWEQGLGQSPARRALVLLAVAFPETPRDQLAALSIGHRDGHLMTLREWTFGDRIESVAHCPCCGESLELNFSLDDIRVPSPQESFPDWWIEQDGYRVRYRVPNSADLEIAGACTDPSKAQEIILSRCLLESAGPNSAPLDAPLPETVARAVITAMAERDPQAEVQLALTCPSCHHAWSAGFDIGAFFWSEITTWARRLLWEVHRLARVYGWSESEILALSPLRRQSYLEMVGL
jgi:hypothetical protein